MTIQSLFIGTALFCSNLALAYPATRIENVRESKFGFTIDDPYRWLENLGSTEVNDWTSAQGTFTRNILDGDPNRAVILKRLNELLSASARRQVLKRFKRIEIYRDLPPGQLKEALYARRLHTPFGNRFGDTNTLPEGYYILDDTYSQDERLGAALLTNDSSGSGILALGSTVDDSFRETLRVPNVNAMTFCFTPTADGIYYAYGNTVRLHRLGTAVASDSILYTSSEDISFLKLSYDNQWLLLTSRPQRNPSNAKRFKINYYIKRMADATSFRLIGTSTPSYDTEFASDILNSANGVIYRLTSEDAPNGKLLKLDTHDLGQPQWKTLVPESKNRVLANFFFGEKRIFAIYKQNANERVAAVNLENGELQPLSLPPLGFAKMARTPDLRVTFSSLVQPPIEYKVDETTLKLSPSKPAAPLLDPLRFSFQEVFFPSRDGTPISMFIVTPKDAPLNGDLPFLLEGYGGFNVSYMPSFDPTIVPWLESGRGYALMNLRGGGEYGEAWHNAGMLRNKQNTFDDAIAAANYLIDHHYTRPSRLGITGSSNGGLLVGAVITQRPDLFGAAICSHPVLDMLRIRSWEAEYGSPDDAGDFNYLMQYSPYQHIAAGVAYPAIMFMTSAHDTLVAPWHAFKTVAKLQAEGSGSVAGSGSGSGSGHKPILLNYQANADHSNRDMKVRNEATADELTFLMRQLGPVSR